MNVLTGSATLTTSVFLNLGTAARLEILGPIFRVVVNMEWLSNFGMWRYMEEDREGDSSMPLSVMNLVNG